MAQGEHKGLIARWLEGKERTEEYARSTLPTNRWSLFWDIFKGRFGKLVLVNLLMLVTFIPVILIMFWRYATILAQGAVGPYGAGLGVGYPVIPNIVGAAEATAVQSDLLFFALMIPAGAIAALGISGGMYIIRNMLWTEGIFVANDFVRGIKRNYLNVLEAVLVFTVTLFLVTWVGNLADLYIAVGVAQPWLLIVAKVVGYIFLVLSIFLCLWMITLGVNYKQGPWALFRNSVIMTIGTFPQTVFFAVLALFPLVFVIFGSGFLMAIGIILLCLFALSYAMLVWMDFSQWAFDRFVNPKLGFTTGKGIYNKDKGTMQGTGGNSAQESAALREYKRMIVAQGKSKLVSRPIKPIDDDMDLYQLPDSFSRDDLRRLKESKKAMEEDVRSYEEEHKDEERYVEYNKQFEEREKALQDEGKKKKPPKPPKMLNKRK